MNARFEPSGALRGELTPPADKSISHRAALLGAMSAEPVRVRNFLDAADTNATLAAVRTLGALVEVRPDELVIRGTGLREAREPAGPIDVGNAGTLMRLLPGWLAAQEGRRFTLDGDDSIRRRPVDRIAEPLGRMGATLEAS
ncbi:MAG TPA: 3-phosphoshikimate 1-carboxyvinyltransferase, partial [Solirubrobacteraceae bacterium]|nr:3-phosphoshikimate 1-carboxyvinyltransferase [Solirubrobacteraceae bacterium]